MANVCIRCGNTQGFLDGWGENGLCMRCWKENPIAESQEIISERNQAKEARNKAIEAIVLTTELPHTSI